MWVRDRASAVWRKSTVLVFTGAAAVVPLFEQMEDGAAISYAATTAFVLLSVGFLLSISLKLSQHLTTR